jgi:hypothetical protein
MVVQGEPELACGGPGKKPKAHYVCGSRHTARGRRLGGEPEFGLSHGSQNAALGLNFDVFGLKKSRILQSLFRLVFS